MDVLITDSMLREFLDTKASAEKIAECLSLCGPSIEKITKDKGETVYHVEITTNRVDAANAYGLAREAVAILPQFGISAKLKESSSKPQQKGNTKLDIKFDIDKTVCQRILAVKLSNIKIEDSPSFIKNRLTAIGQRPINNVIDITNYVMFMLGIPLHAFDADSLGKYINVREAQKGEKFKTLDDRDHKAIGGEVIFDNGNGEIVDLPSIMGTKNTSVTSSTKTIILVSEHLDPLRVRQASLKHEIRTFASTINEKDPDPNMMDAAIQAAIRLLEKYAQGQVSSTVFDWYPTPRKSIKIKVSKVKVDEVLGVSIPKDQMSKILTSLGFGVSWKGDTTEVVVPTFRVKDVSLSEDIVEEVARIYGYFNLPSNLPTGAIPNKPRDSKFSFESKVKSILKGYGGIEVYTFSFVSKKLANENALKIKNPLGEEGEYMRTSLTPSLIEAAKSNTQEKSSFHLFEIANIYITNKKSLPDERMTLSGVFAHTDFRHAKGTLEALFKELNVSKSPELMSSGAYFTYEIDMEDLMKAASNVTSYTPIPKFPAQVEDITIVFKKDTKTGHVIDLIKKTSDLVLNVELIDSYDEAFTFRIYYQHSGKTLTDDEVKEVRERVIKNLVAVKLKIK